MGEIVCFTSVSFVTKSRVKHFSAYSLQYLELENGTVHIGTIYVIRIVLTCSLQHVFVTFTEESVNTYAYFHDTIEGNCC